MPRSRRGWGAIRKLPSGRYQARFPDPDHAGLVPALQTFASKTAADRWLSKKRTELDAGSAVDDRAGNRPLSEWWEPYRRTWGGLKESTRASYDAAWRLRIEPVFGSTRVRRITPGVIDEWVSTMINDGVSRSKITEALGVLGRVLDRVVRDRVLPRNPCAERVVTLPRKQPTERPVLSPAEVERIAAACASARDQVLIRLLAYGGLRIGEAFALQWSSIDVAGRTVTVRESVASSNGPPRLGSTKTYATRTIDIPAKLAAQLSALRDSAKSDLVFPNRQGAPLRYRNWRRDTWDPATSKAGLVVLPHDLRATCASLLIDAGASPKDVQAHLGHEDITTTLQLYARVRPRRSADLASKLDALVAEVN
jgi:integrase